MEGGRASRCPSSLTRTDHRLGHRYRLLGRERVVALLLDRRDDLAGQQVLEEFGCRLVGTLKEAIETAAGDDGHPLGAAEGADLSSTLFVRVQHLDRVIGLHNPEDSTDVLGHEPHVTLQGNRADLEDSPVHRALEVPGGTQDVTDRRPYHHRRNNPGVRFKACSCRSRTTSFAAASPQWRATDQYTASRMPASTA